MPKPVLQALVMADHIYVDQASQKKVIAGTFHDLWAKKFPCRMSRNTYAFISLTDFRGKTAFELRYRDLDEDNELMHADFSITAENPLQTVELIVEIPGFPMPKPGVYVFELLYKKEVLGSLRMNVQQKGDVE